MKKIIAAFDGLKYSESAARYAIEIAKKHNGKLFGIFLEDFTYHSYSITDLIGEESYDQRAAYLNKMDTEQRESAINHFSRSCENEGLLYSIHRDKNIAIRELVNETRYADLVVIQNNETLTHYSERAPSDFVITLLEKTESPVLLVPSVYKEIEKVIFLYDGEPSSIFAIKHFAYVLPELDNASAELLCIKSKGDDNSLPDAHYLKEWLKLNYPHLGFRVLIGDPGNEIINYLVEQTNNCLVVLGAYNRGSFSRMIHKSMADNIMLSVNVPLFISHR